MDCGRVDNKHCCLKRKAEVIGEPHAHVFPLQLSPAPFFFFFFLPICFVNSGFSHVVTPVLILERQRVYRRGWDRKTALGFDRRVNEFCCV